MAKNRYALLTVDTEALPKRAAKDHVKRLIWGQLDNGTAGVAEMAQLGDEFGAKHIFFVDMCGSYAYLDETLEVVRWLDAAGQDVQLHTHPEYLPDAFWKEHGLAVKPRLMNKYADARAAFVIKHFAALMEGVTSKPVLAHRAGSFRWNASTLRALKAANIPLSFNNSMTALGNGQCVYSEPTNQPFTWSNGIIEVPMTEKMIAKKDWYARLTYPESVYFHFRPWWGKLLFNAISGSPDLAVFLLHSWSLLHWDDNGHAMYKDDQRLEGYRKLLARLTKDYDVITSAEFLELHAQGKICSTHETDLALAEFVPQKKSASRPAR